MISGRFALEDSVCGVFSLTANMLTRSASPKSSQSIFANNANLKLKTPIISWNDSDPIENPFIKDEQEICVKCGAFGVKHAIFAKEWCFCSLSCVQEFSEVERSHSAPRENPENEDDDDLDGLRRKEVIANSYDWMNHLLDSEFDAAPVTCFKHAPVLDCWQNVHVGMRVEVENTDCEDFSECFPDSFWVATVIKIAGYNALIRYDGFGDDASRDFWVNMCSLDVHPVGWCATRGRPLIPPKTIENKYKDWKQFLVIKLTGARTLPSAFHTRVNESLVSRFKCEMNLEVVCKNKISQVSVATIIEIVGKRLNLVYHDADNNTGFWCHEDSPLIHAVGWALRVGHPLSAPESYIKRLEENQFLQQDATDAYFLTPATPVFAHGLEFKIGMKIEAVDPSNASQIGAATVMKVLGDGYIMVRLDNKKDDLEGEDWFCYHSTSAYIFPAGFCRNNAIQLIPPRGYRTDQFEWNRYLQVTSSIAAPKELFAQTVPDHGFKEGMWLEVAGSMEPNIMCVGYVRRVVGRLLKIHFDGWEDYCDQWFDCGSPDIYPVGWCRLVGHKLMGPPISSDDESDDEPIPGTSMPHSSVWESDSDTFQERVKPDQSLLPCSPDVCAISCSDVTTSGIKVIPKIGDSLDEGTTIDIEAWNAFDVSYFLKINDCEAYCDSFCFKDIDGTKLLNLTKDQIVDLTGLKVGPSIKIYDLIQQLKAIINSAQERKN